MKTIMECGRCGARSAKHKPGCIGRKVRITVYLKGDFEAAEKAGFPKRPVNIRCFDSVDQTADRYTLVRTTPIVFIDREEGRQRWEGHYIYGSANSAPYHPQGIGQVAESGTRPLWNAGKYGGLDIPPAFVPIRWHKLPVQVRKMAWSLAINDTDRE